VTVVPLLVLVALVVLVVTPLPVPAPLVVLVVLAPPKGVALSSLEHATRAKEKRNASTPKRATRFMSHSSGTKKSCRRPT
jgi:hypothetical protein